MYHSDKRLTQSIRATIQARILRLKAATARGLAQRPYPATRAPLQRLRVSTRAVSLGIQAALTLAALTGPLVTFAQPAAQQKALKPSPPHRIITLAPSATEMVYAAGGADQLVATVSSSNFPPPAQALPRIGDGIILNAERILIHRPTLLIGWLRSGIALQIEALADEIGAQMMYSTPRTLRDIPADVRRIGQALGTEAVASEAAATMEARIDALEAQYAHKPPVPVFIEVGSLPLYTIGNDPLVNDALRICGATNIYGDTGVPAPRVPIESVLVHNPQLIIATGHPGNDPTDIRQRWTTYGLPAALNGHIHITNPDALYRPGPRLIDAAEALCPAVEAVRAVHSAASPK